ncbi:MAG: amidohydrolase family protein [Gemmatimonadaceae bacterium]
MRLRLAPPFRLSLLLLAPALLSGQAPVDSALAEYIATIRAIDTHAHPMLPVSSGAPADTDFDALPLDGIPPFGFPHRLTLDDPIWRGAQAALYGVPVAASDSVAYRKALTGAVASAINARGLHFPEWALDRAGVDIMLANRVAMGPGLSGPHFRWVSFVDALMLPLDTRGEARTPDTHVLYPKEAKLLQRYLRALNLTRLPTTLDGYVRTVVVPTLDRQRAGGAVAVKFEAAYLRPLDFDDPDPAVAARVYAQYASGGTPTRAEYKELEDYLFRAIAREAGLRGMAVQIHVLETFGSYYRSAGAAPHLLEAAFNDSTLRGTKFIVTHGGWPLVNETQALLAKPNVYADISAMDLILSPTELASVLRQWLGEFPDKVLFGSDAFDGGAEQGWEQVAWVGSMTARRALAISLSGMLSDGEITRSRAEMLARMVLRENAIAAYRLRGADYRPPNAWNK